MVGTHHITLPGGFLAAGVACGIKASGKNDLAVLCASKDVPTAVVTTRNQVIGAPIAYDRQVLPAGYGMMRGIVVNSGNSNVCTGKAGLGDAKTMARLTAQGLGASAEKILVASTGVIGQPLAMGKIRKGISSALAKLGTQNDQALLQAIMTTDLREKSAVTRMRIGGRNVTIAGVVKGSGMICPSMATMISLITTDAAITPAALGKALKTAVANTFNAVTIDSDTSTSDIALIMSSGQAGNKPLTGRADGYQKFVAALERLCRTLAIAMVADGEGATKIIQIVVRGATNNAQAEIAAKSVADSPLVKCAVHGCDPNWGRILMALGKSTAKIDPEKLSVKIGTTTVFARGTGRKLDAKNAKTISKHLAGDTVQILCDLRQADGFYRAWTCDLSKEYITINADYHT